MPRMCESNRKRNSSHALKKVGVFMCRILSDCDLSPLFNELSKLSGAALQRLAAKALAICLSGNPSAPSIPQLVLDSISEGVELTNSTAASLEERANKADEEYFRETDSTSSQDLRYDAFRRARVFYAAAYGLQNGRASTYESIYESFIGSGRSKDIIGLIRQTVEPGSGADDAPSSS